MKPSYLIHGLPGHPLHPPLTDATIGTYTVATIAGLTDVLGITNAVGAQVWWFALVAGLIIGLLQSLSTAFLPFDYVYLLLYVLLAAILVLRREGLTLAVKRAI